MSDLLRFTYYGWSKPDHETRLSKRALKELVIEWGLYLID